MMFVVFVEVDVSCFSGCELTSRFVAFDRRISVIDCDVVRNRIVAAIDFPANRAHEPIWHALNVLLVATPSCKLETYCCDKINVLGKLSRFAPASILRT
jgi:hypothetical protein